MAAVTRVGIRPNLIIWLWSRNVSGGKIGSNHLPKLALPREFVLDKLLPCAVRYSDPKLALEAYLDYDKNDPGILSNFGYLSALCGLILARLHGQNHYEGLRQRYSKFFVSLSPETKEKALKIIAYLDCDPLPAL